MIVINVSAGTHIQISGVTDPAHPCMHAYTLFLKKVLSTNLCNRLAPASTCLVLPTDAVTDQLSGNILRLRRVREWRASGLGSIKLLKHGLQKAMLLGNM